MDLKFKIIVIKALLYLLSALNRGYLDENQHKEVKDEVVKLDAELHESP